MTPTEPTTSEPETPNRFEVVFEASGTVGQGTAQTPIEEE